MKGHWIKYSAEELAWLSANRTMPISDYARAFNEAFARDVAPANLHALRKRQGWKTGRTGQFAKGQEPANKGVPCPPGVGAHHPNAVATRFKKGHGRSGVAVDLYKPIGTERISKDGYPERKINDDMPLQGRWRAIHLINWEAANGPIPKGYCLKSKDGAKTNSDPSNWMLIERALLPALNGGRHKRRLAFNEAHPDVRPTLVALATVEHKARQARRRKEPA